VAALSDWCPHRGARLSLGLCESEGTVTCPYHGYVFDGTGQCVAGLIERPDSPFIGKLRTRAYPTEERMGIVIYFRRHLARRARDHQRKPAGASTAPPEASPSGFREQGRRSNEAPE
jgi:phenylpropionate dioxygenase-like ring-hydroxylating dioxygenase large terminal subunit